MPKVNFKRTFIDPSGKPAMEPKRDYTKMKPLENGDLQADIVVENGYAVMEEINLSNVVVDILQDHYDGDTSLPGTERIKRHLLANKVHTADPDGIEYDNDELRLIEDLAAKKRPTVVLGRIKEAING